MNTLLILLIALIAVWVYCTYRKGAWLSFVFGLVTALVIVGVVYMIWQVKWSFHNLRTKKVMLLVLDRLEPRNDQTARKIKRALEFPPMQDGVTYLERIEQEMGKTHYDRNPGRIK